MSSSKFSYLISEVVCPYFNTINIEGVKSLLTIYYNETTSKQVKKQLEIKVRFWLETDSAVKAHNSKIYLMGHATSVLLAEKLLSSLKDNEMPLS